MSDYARLRLNLKYSVYSDYSRPDYDKQFEILLSPNEGMWRRLEVGNALPTSLDIDEFSTVDALVIANTSTTDYITVGYTSSFEATACSFRLGAGDFVKIVDVDSSVAPTLQSGAGNVTAEIYVSGA